MSVGVREDDRDVDVHGERDDARRDDRDLNASAPGPRQTLSLQLPGVPSCAVFARAALAAHDTGIGPALVTALDTTIWIPPLWHWTVDDNGVLILEAP